MLEEPELSICGAQMSTVGVDWIEGIFIHGPERHSRGGVGISG